MRTLDICVEPGDGLPELPGYHVYSHRSTHNTYACYDDEKGSLMVLMILEQHFRHIHVEF